MNDRAPRPNRKLILSRETLRVLTSSDPVPNSNTSSSRPTEPPAGCTQTKPPPDLPQKPPGN